MAVQKYAEIADGIYFVGSGLQENGLHCMPYLIVEGKEAVLIDPGSVLDFEYVYENVCSLIPLEQLKYIILHHEDPDFCSAVPLFEQRGATFKIITHWRTQTLIRYYGVKSEYYLVSKNKFKFIFETGRELSFILTPYLHFAGSIVTYDNKTKTLFSSDLFGAFSASTWNLYADDSYMERMLTFHEHYMPSHDIMSACMDIFLGMEINLIAPQHGSLIKERIREHIIALRNLECGTMLKPVHKSLAKAGGYSGLCNKIIKRMNSIFGKEEVIEVLSGIDIQLNEDMEITDYNYTGNILWNMIFEKILSKKGLNWLLLLEPYVKTLSSEYEVMIPQVYQSHLKRFEEDAIKLNKENEMLKEINMRLEKGLNEAMNKLTRCPLTGIYNYEFFQSFLSSEIRSILEGNSEQNPCLIIISPDRIENLRYTLGDQEVDETLRNLVYLLKEAKDNADMIFRVKETQFALYIQHSTKEKAKEFSELFRNEVAASKKFIEPITVSIGIASFHEIRNRKVENLDRVFFEMALERLNYAKLTGNNKIYADKLEEREYSGKCEILLVDTDEVSISVMRTFLENYGYQVCTASDGEEAYQLAEVRKINLIVSEVMLPKMDGFLLRERLLAGSTTKEIPFIMISYQKDENTIKRAAALGIEHYFKRPIMMSEFLGVVGNRIKRETVE